MIISLDTETAGFDQSKLHCACICYQDYEVETFQTVEQVHTRILELEEELQKKNERLYVYAHNMSFDFVSIQEHFFPENEIYTTRPFIANTWRIIKGKKRNTIKWLCTYGLSRMPLEELGEILEEPKTPTPQWLYDGTFPLDKQAQYLTERYCAQDAIIVMKFYQHLKRRMQEEGLDTRFLITTSQISMQGFLKQLSERENAEEFFENVTFKRLHGTKYRKKIHEGIRGGRTEVFKTGMHTGLTRIDANSLYPYIAVTKEFPHLKTEMYLHEPEKQGISHDWVLGKMGVSNVIIETPQKHNYGYLPVRIRYGSEITTFYPKSDENTKILVGTWTHIEIKKAIEEGYILHHISWSVLYEKGPNPFVGYIDELYKKRQQTTNKFENTYLKLMMNGCLGKFATNRHRKDYAFGNISELKKMKEDDWEPIYYYKDGTVNYSKDLGFDRKRYYAPIWYAYITAYGRTFLYDHMKHIPPEKMYYCDTDGLLCEPNPVIQTFKYSDALGNWKVEEKNAPATIYGRKALVHGNKATLNRVPKKVATPEAMLSGYIEYEEPLSIGRGGLEAGKPQNAFRDLIEQQEEEQKKMEYTQKIFVDTESTLTPEQGTILDKLTGTSQ